MAAAIKWTFLGILEIMSLMVKENIQVDQWTGCYDFHREVRVRPNDIVNYTFGMFS